MEINNVAKKAKQTKAQKKGKRREVPLLNDFIAIDFETANYSRESAYSVGLVKFRKGKVTDSFYSLIQPLNLYIRSDFTEIHGLTVEDVKDAPTFVLYCYQGRNQSCGSCCTVYSGWPSWKADSY